jgi:Ser-tRNA(Ala) deacylase AlaX
MFRIQGRSGIRSFYNLTQPTHHTKGLTNMNGLSFSTERVYYSDTYNTQIVAEVADLGSDDKGNYAVFNKTIFHPQGGGQPSDEGYFLKDEVKYTVKYLEAPRDPQSDPYIIKHYYEKDRTVDLEIGDQVTQVVDFAKRELYARLHSAGHLLANAVNQLYPQFQGCNGNHFPKTSFVIFEGTPPPLLELKVKAEEKVNELVRENLSVRNNYTSVPRTIQFGDLPAYPCGGTHVKSSGDIGKVTIRSVKKEKRGIKIGYDIE